MSTPVSFFKRLSAPAILLLVTIGLVFLLNLKEKVPKMAAVVGSLPMVEVVEVKPQNLTLDIRSNGVVSSSVEARLVPEVTGKIIWVSKQWHDGGFFQQGQIFFKIERHQYENYVAKARAQLAEAKALYIQEQGMAHVAKREWEQRNRGAVNERNDTAKSLALREPQFESAKARYEAAVSDLKLAEINLSKTDVKAPFNGIVLKKSANIGQFVSANQLLGEFYSVDSADVRVPLTESNQYLIDIPKLRGTQSTPVQVSFSSKTGATNYQGSLIRTESVLDEITKVLYAVVRVDDPYQLKKLSEKPALRLGSYVSVAIPGRDMSGLYVLPPAVLRGGNRVYTVDQDNILRSHQVVLQSNFDGLTVVSSGLDGVVRVVTGRVGEAMVGRSVDINIQESSADRSVIGVN